MDSGSHQDREYQGCVSKGGCPADPARLVAKRQWAFCVCCAASPYVSKRITTPPRPARPACPRAANGGAPALRWPAGTKGREERGARRRSQSRSQPVDSNSREGRPSGAVQPSTMSTQTARGLNNFISDIRNCECRLHANTRSLSLSSQEFFRFEQRRRREAGAKRNGKHPREICE
jgi:hypothetical protein